MRILFLDDDPARHRTFLKWAAGHEVTAVFTYQECVQKLASEPRFDFVSLDHDLGGKIMVSSFDPVEKTGYSVATYIRYELSPEKWPTQLVIHSMNPRGARDMYNLLSRCEGISLSLQPFSYCA